MNIPRCEIIQDICTAVPTKQSENTEMKSGSLACGGRRVSFMSNNTLVKTDIQR